MHYSLSTEKVYLYWVRFFIRWHGRGGQMKHPRTMGTSEIEAFLTMLSTERKATKCNDKRSLMLRAMQAAYLRQVESRPTLGVTKHTAAAFGVLAAAVKHAGRSPRPCYNDLWIAAQAIEHGYVLLTLNTNDFLDLPGLKLATLAPKTQA